MENVIANDAQDDLDEFTNCISSTKASMLSSY